MIAFTVRMRFRTEDREEIAGYVRELTAGSRREPGCIIYAPHTVESEPDTLLIYELYQDEAAVDAHRASEHFRRFAVGGLYQHMLDRTVETLTVLA